MKKMSKILSIILIAMMMLTIATTVMAADGDSSTAITPSLITGEGSKVDVTGISGLGNSIVKVLTTVGIVASVIVLVVLGIKYMMGSAEEKAEYKKTLMPYIIGAGLVFAASGIANIVYTFMQNAV
ncbi:MAG: hypothetical protein HFJ35_03945 [Clostridia bacterium]|nr:hypothetical protein [Clostridia bacterium]